MSSSAAQSSMSSALVCMISDSAKGRNLSDVFFSNTSDNQTITLQHTNTMWKFTWDFSTQSWIVSAFFAAYYFIQFPSGLFINRWGSRRVLICGLIVQALFQFLTVPATLVSVELLCLVRILAGIGGGVLYTASFGLVGNWTPQKEINLMFGIVEIGLETGISYSYLTSLVACDVEFQGGWPFVFYANVVLDLVLVVIIWYYMTDFPETNRFTSEAEARYIRQTGNLTGGGDTVVKTPVKAILTSRPVWGLVACELGVMCVYYMVLTEGPNYLKNIIRLDNDQINLLQALPFLVVPFFGIVQCRFADWLVTSGYLTTTQLRKLADTLSKVVGLTCLAWLSVAPEGGTGSIIIIYTLAALYVALAYCSYIANPGDLSPAHVGFMTAVAQTGSMWGTFVLPIMTSAITESNTRESWQIVFAIVAAVQVVTWLIYMAFGSGDRQPWANQHHEQDHVIEAP